MAKKQKKVTKFERKRRRNAIIIAILAGGLILSTILGILLYS